MTIHSTDIYPEIGVRVRAVRAMRGLRQEDVARLVGMSRASINNIEQGRQQLPIHRLYEIAAVLDCEVDALMPPVLQDREGQADTC